MPDHRPTIKSHLQAFTAGSLRQASFDLLGVLGYRSDKTIALDGSKPKTFLNFIRENNPEANFDEQKALFDDWETADLLFQLTDEELSRETSLFQDIEIKPRLLRSYLFFAIELNGASAVNGSYARGKLTAIARQLNRVFPMPVMVLIKHLTDKQPVLSVAVINRRQNKRDTHKDVLEKATIIRDISLTEPHRGHLDILDSFVFDNLTHPKKLPITNFDTLHAAWEQIFNVELLNERFYKELANWYFWALPQVEFPADLEPDAEKRRATGLIRLLTRLIFCWFLKEKGLIPEKLFHAADLEKILKGFDPESETSSTYYQAILQNLFFATLNQRMGKDGKGNPYRVFAKDEGFLKNRATYDVNNLYRYESLFRESPEDALAHFADIPFLNGGLFECLDRTEDETDKKRYLDGFSRNAKKRPHVPDRLFFDSGETADLSTAYGDKKRKAEQVTGLITILNRYKFTIVENTPIDQEIALDPELLGKVFENLLASYNEETKTTARKQTGSFYTPRPIVDYMVDESLKAHLLRCLMEKAGMKEVDAKEGLDILFAYREKDHAFSESEVATLIAAIDKVKILDPACGSGAFPMGALHKLVYILGKLDHDNERWEQIRIDEAQKIHNADERRKKIAEIVSNFQDNNDDYGRKLYLIENCLYGVDIQPIAIQITKLRFFISLVCDQKTNRNKKDNHGIRPLPNLETKFVAANSLIGLPEMTQSLLVDPRVGQIEKEIEALYHSHFSIQRRDQKLALQRKIKSLRQELAKLLAESLMSPAKSKHVAEWDPFNPQSSADFFDPHWMFGRSLANGFDVVIGNPPYVQIRDIPPTNRRYFEDNYKFATGRFNLFYLFIEISANICRKKGMTSLIVPDRLLLNTQCKAIRKWLLEMQAISEIVSFNEQVFDSAVVDSILIMFQNAPMFRGEVIAKVKAPPQSISIIENRIIPLTYFQLSPSAQFDLNYSPTRHEMISKIRSKSCCLEEISESKDGIIQGKVADELFLKSEINEHCKMLLFGENVMRFQICFDSNWVNYRPKEMMDLEIKRRGAGVRPGLWMRNPEIFSRPKILTRQTADKIIAAFDNGSFYYANTLHGTTITNPSYEPIFVLGVLNSRITTWFYRSNTDEHGKAFAQIKIELLRKLPIPKVSQQEQEPVVNLVEEILRAKEVNSTADTSALEREIDQQVYTLYGLTLEEIAIVEETAK